MDKKRVKKHVMKKFFLLYFIVLSPLLFSQSAYRFTSENYSVTQNAFAQNDILSASHRNLIILDRDFHTENISAFRIDTKGIDNEPKDFTSFLLIEQLETLKNKTPLNITHNPTLERFIRVFLKEREEELCNLMGRSDYYFPMIEKYLDKYDLPLEIKYLAIVESALKPKAISTSGAKGLWQFMYATGKQYGLEIDSYVDDRFDPVKSTEAACKYLSSLYQTFNDWDLALAAYNSGPGNVRKAIKRSGGKKNYWEIRQYLSQETRSYVPAFYASYYIFEFAKEHNLESSVSKLTYFEVDTIRVNNALYFDTIAKNISIDKELLQALNPQYKRDYVPYSEEKNYYLTLPINLVSVFLEKEEHIYDTKNQVKNQNLSSNSIEITRFNSYVVKVGDNLSKIALKFNISLDQLKRWNGLQTDFLIVDQRLVISDKTETTYKNKKDITIYNNNAITNPFSPEVSPNFSTKSKLKQDSLLIDKYQTYTVKEGDTLFKISRKFLGVTIDQIRNWNNLLEVQYLKPGTVIKIFKS